MSRTSSTVRQILIRYVLPNDPVTMIAAAALSMAFNLIGRMVGNYFITIVSTPAPCFVFVGVARLWTTNGSKKLLRGNSYTNLICTGLFLSMISDILMALQINEKVNQMLFAAGLGIFCIVQLLYSIAFTFCPPRQDVKGANPIQWHWNRGVPFLLYAVFWWITTETHLEKGVMRHAIGIYIVLECVTAWRACARIGAHGRVNNPVNVGMQFLGMFGMVLFTLCDSMIGYHTFVYNTASSLGVVNMGIYWFGQAMVAVSCNEMLTVRDMMDIAAYGSDRALAGVKAKTNKTN